jgi:molybdopterin/thiamine biosynthesis adenylyltransferase
VSTLGRPKTEVLAEVARDINPDVELRVFGAGVDADNVADFLAGADLYVDGSLRPVATGCVRSSDGLWTAWP